MKKYRKVKIINQEESREKLVEINIRKKRRKEKRLNFRKILIYIFLLIICLIIFVLYKTIKRTKSSNKLDYDYYDSILKKHMRTSIEWPLPNEINFLLNILIDMK